MKAVVLLSGGLDSTTCLAKAIEDVGEGNVVALGVSYGQKHAKELDAFQAVCKHYNVPGTILDLSSVFKGTSCTLIDKDKAVPTGTYAEQQAGKSSPVSTYVPFRNGLFLSAATSFALSVFADASAAEPVRIYIGVHADDTDANAYPDCSPAFVAAMQSAISIGTASERITFIAPFAGMRKEHVVQEGLRLHVPYELTWSCYNGGDKPCGKCATCLDRAKAFESCGVADPALK